MRALSVVTLGPHIQTFGNFNILKKAADSEFAMMPARNIRSAAGVQGSYFGSIQRPLQMG